MGNEDSSGAFLSFVSTEEKRGKALTSEQPVVDRMPERNPFWVVSEMNDSPEV